MSNDMEHKTDTDSERAAFEKWASDKFYSGMANVADTRKGSSYNDPAHHMAWYAFQAGRASLAASAGATDYRGWAYAKLPEPVAYSLGLAKYAHSSNIIAANEFTPDTEHADEWESLVTMDQARDFADRTYEFRERRGDESLAASAGSEPVAWVDERALSWLANSRSLSATITTKLEKGKSFERPMPLYTHPSPPEGMGGGWQDIETAPKDEIYRDGPNAYADYILVWYPGALAPLRARWWQSDSGRCNFLADGSWAIFATHWRALPPAPPIAAGGGKEASHG